MKKAKSLFGAALSALLMQVIACEDDTGNALGAAGSPNVDAGGKVDTGGEPQNDVETDSSTQDGNSEASSPELAPGDREVVVRSQCTGQTVVVGINGGFVQECAAGGSCPDGTTCLTTRDPPGCFWDFPAADKGKNVLNEGESVTYKLRAKPIDATVANGPEKGKKFPIKWSGNVYARTGCNAKGEECKTGICNVSGSTGACADGVGPQGPVTLAEFTLSPDGVDFYDVSIINGTNIPISMGPIGGAKDSANPYTCATAGSVQAQPGLMACSWKFDPRITKDGSVSDESLSLRAVVPGGAACTSDANCAKGTVCGVAVLVSQTTITRSCGALVGWWTADELCVYTANQMKSPVNCSEAVAKQGKVVDLYQCSGANPNSCYSQDAANPTCCGCPTWVFDDVAVSVAPGFKCHSHNPEWEKLSQPWVEFVKKACPTAYSFPFDDATSTFTCATDKVTDKTPNSMGYEIVLCPGGKGATQ